MRSQPTLSTYRPATRNAFGAGIPPAIVKKHCLIIEGDTNKLAEQGLSFGKLIDAMARPVAGHVHSQRL